MINTCKTCKKDFEKTHNKNRVYKYCSLKCMGADKEKTVAHGIKMKGKTAWNKGKKNVYTAETRIKMRKRMLGKIPWNKDEKGLQTAWNKGTRGILKQNSGSFKKGQISPNKGKKGSPCSEKTKKQISDFFLNHPEITKNRKHPKGENHHNWKGGITPINDTIRKSIEGKLWIQSVFARDGYTCQKTGIKGGKLAAHHIQNFSSHPELRFAIDNGITLSEKAHKEFHKKYGRKNNTTKQLDKFLGVEA